MVKVYKLLIIALSLLPLYVLPILPWHRYLLIIW